MRSHPTFAKQSPEFWAHVKHLGQLIGYTDRGTKQVRTYSKVDILKALTEANLTTNHLAGPTNVLLDELVEYSKYRAHILNDEVQYLLMNAPDAKSAWEALVQKHQPVGLIAMNKQKGDKKAPNYLTAIVNLLLEQTLGVGNFNPAPRELTTFTKAGRLVTTLSRRVDGAYPTTIDPVALWEIKEYYYTTTFGSRVADGIYETMLDGYELDEVYNAVGRRVEHLLIVDSHFTWWECGRSYLCRIIDLLNMGLVQEVLFGREVITRLPAASLEWATRSSQKKSY